MCQPILAMASSCAISVDSVQPLGGRQSITTVICIQSRPECGKVSACFHSHSTSLLGWYCPRLLDRTSW